MSPLILKKGRLIFFLKNNPKGQILPKMLFFWLEEIKKLKSS